MKRFYNVSGSICSYNLEYLDRGTLGRIYKVSDDICLKLFYINSDDIILPNIEELSTIRKLKLRKFYEIFDFIYDIQNNFVGYTMKYYKKEDIDILTMPTCYLLDNLYYMYRSVVVLSENNIYTDDLSFDNIIINKDGMVVVDTDLYYTDKNISSKIILKENIDSLESVFENLFYHSINRHYIDIYNKYCPIVNSLCNKINSISGIERFCKELDGYKYPIDYIKKKTRSRR